MHHQDQCRGLCTLVAVWLIDLWSGKHLPLHPLIRFQAWDTMCLPLAVAELLPSRITATPETTF